MLKKILYIEYYDSGLVVEYFIGNVNIGFVGILNHKKLNTIILEIDNLIKDLKKDGRFNNVKMESHLLLSRKFIKKDLKSTISNSEKSSWINMRYIKILENNNYHFTKKIKKISTFRKYYYFYSMKFSLIIRYVFTFKYSSMNKVRFKIPTTNYVGILKISFK
ncbi:hypothetical protein ACRCD8_09885 [Aliarcobacter sp. ERUVET-8]|uniref:hypothetical protein n=1 Tax=Aliarcobacter sp. ERUVET-8 TaxID=3429684 RepID=UPI003D6B3D53